MSLNANSGWPYLPMAGPLLALVGCYSVVVTPESDAAAPRDTRTVSPLLCNGVECAPGESCRDWGGVLGEACSAPCSRNDGYRCSGSSLYCWARALEAEGWCFPGQPADPAECSSALDCGAGEGCVRPLPDEAAICAPLCNDDSECARNEACGGACVRVCNPYEVDTCPRGRVCRDVQSLLESVARDCLLRDGSRGDPENCPTGEICVGLEDGGRMRCRLPTDLEGLGCPPGQIEFVNGECYPRRE
jgi:hypothetical protein